MITGTETKQKCNQGKPLSWRNGWIDSHQVKENGSNLDIKHIMKRRYLITDTVVTAR